MKAFQTNTSLLPLWFFIIGLFTVNNILANIKLPAIFSDGMVLQQNTNVSIWGWADPGELVTVTGSWSSKMITTTVDAKGNWKITIATTTAGGPYTLTIKGNNNIELKDVLLGEVWVCSGQSNMGFALKNDQNGKEEIASANFPLVRFFSVNRQYGLQQFDDVPGSVWKETSPATAGSFSAVAFYFAKKIQERLHVPVGIVYAAWGVTPAEAWTPRDVLKNDSSLSVYFDRWKNIQDNVGKDSAAYHVSMDNWKKDTSVSKKPQEPQTFYYYKRPWREPSVLFNGMIEPVVPYAIRGVIWYQGESNVGFADEYYHLFSSMITSWRNKWNDKKLSFYFVQIAPFGYSDMEAAAQVREAQYQVAQNIPFTGMAVTTDVGNMKDIHPTRKREVGNRLALIALAKDYGVNTIHYKGPECKKAFIKNEQVVLEFSLAGSPLAQQGSTVNGFEIGYRLPGTDSLFFISASAKIEDDKVIVWSNQVKNPVEVRYGWLLPAEANLCNKDGLPAFPFRKEVSTK